MNTLQLLLILSVACSCSPAIDNLVVTLIEDTYLSAMQEIYRFDLDSTGKLDRGKERLEETHSTVGKYITYRLNSPFQTTPIVDAWVCKVLCGFDQFCRTRRGDSITLQHAAGIPSVSSK